jgi:GT2 family glycosyltransferase
MTVREKYSTTLRSIQSLKTNTPDELYDFILVDCGIPNDISGVFVIKTDTTNPQINRIKAAQLVQTKYTIFTDNDVIFEQNWLQNLLQCAEETNAGIVAPAYIWNKDKIHMFGGTITIKDGNFYEKHDFANEHRNILHSQIRKTCDYVEYHCLLIKSEFRDLLDPNYKCVHEHIDLCLGAKRLGHEIYIEPTSVIMYLNNTKLQDCDIDLFKDRWNINDCDHDINYFCKKWGFPDTTFDDIRRYIKIHAIKMR